MATDSIEDEDLVRRCSVSGDFLAWEEFVRRFHHLIAAVVLRSAARMGDGSRQTVDDLIQETYLRFSANGCKILKNFDHRHTGAFAGFVKVVASNAVRDHFKAIYSQKRDLNRTEGLSEDFVPAAGEQCFGSPTAIERAVLIEQVKRHLSSCIEGPNRDRDIKIFWLHYREGLPAAEIASLLDISLGEKGVESLIRRMRTELGKRLMPTESQLHNVARKNI
jgi:RNA polymerase sigma-70 factor (ECF subfamily)